MSRFLRLWGPVLLVAAGVAVFSHLPRPPRPPIVPDWGLHGIEFAALGFTLVRALGGGLGTRVSWTTAGVAVALASAYGVADELHQSFVPERDVSARDVAADAAGATAGAMAALGAARLVGTRAGNSRRPPASLVVELVTGPGCPLCEEARAVLARLGERLPLRVQEKRIETAPELAERYRLEIPVVIVAGRKISKGKVDEARLAASLEARLRGRLA